MYLYLPSSSASFLGFCRALYRAPIRGASGGEKKRGGLFADLKIAQPMPARSVSPKPLPPPPPSRDDRGPVPQAGSLPGSNLNKKASPKPTARLKPSTIPKQSASPLSPVQARPTPAAEATQARSKSAVQARLKQTAPVRLTQTAPIRPMSSTKARPSLAVQARPLQSGQGQPPRPVPASHKDGEILPNGTWVKNRYEIISLIGQGGMAEVYLAYDHEDQQSVALKILSHKLLEEKEWHLRFTREAKMMTSFSDTNFVKIFNYGQDGDLSFIAMEYVKGSTLKSLIQQEKYIMSKMASSLAIQIAAGLKTVHDHGTVHLDIKPQNILLDQDMVAKITDFGIAHAAISNHGSIDDTPLGSLQYISPEQIMGEPVSGRSDIYSLGLTLYEMITGVLPFPKYKDDRQLIQLQLHNMPKRPRDIRPEVSQGMEDIILKCIQKHPDDRYQTMEDLILDLERFRESPHNRVGLSNHQAINPWNADLPEEAVMDGQHYGNIKLFTSQVQHTQNTRVASYFFFLILVSVLLYMLYSLAVQAYGSLGTFGAFTHSKKGDNIFVVGNYVGKHIEEIQEALNQYNIVPEVVFANNDSVKSGFVFAQDPPQGLKIPMQELTLTLTVSQGKERIEVPYVDNLPMEEAKKMLKDKGFNLLEKREYSPNVMKDKAIRTDPPGGTLLPLHDNVTLYVSDGQSEALIPDLVGLGWREAEEFCKKNNIRLVGLPLSDHKDQIDFQDFVTDEGKHPLHDYEVHQVSQQASFIVQQASKPGTKVAAGTQLMVIYGAEEDAKYIVHLKEAVKEQSMTQPRDNNGRSGSRDKPQKGYLRNYAGMKWPQVRDELNQMGIGPDNIELQRMDESIAHDSLYVVRQSIPGGSQVRPGTTIRFILGTYDQYLQDKVEMTRQTESSPDPNQAPPANSGSGPQSPLTP